MTCKACGSTFTYCNVCPPKFNNIDCFGDCLEKHHNYGYCSSQCYKVPYYIPEVQKEKFRKLRNKNDNIK